MSVKNDDVILREKRSLNFAFQRHDPIRFKPTIFGNYSIRINNWPVGKIYKPRRIRREKSWTIVIAGQIPMSCNHFDEAIANAYIFAANLCADKGIELSLEEQSQILGKLQDAQIYLSRLIESGEATNW